MGWDGDGDGDNGMLTACCFRGKKKRLLRRVTGYFLRPTDGKGRSSSSSLKEGNNRPSYLPR